MPYKVLIDTLNHNGRLRVPGELIDMNEADAAPLIKIGAIKTIAVAVNPQTSGPGDEDGQDNQNPETGSAIGGATEQAGSAESGDNEAKQNTVQEQFAGSASADSGAGSDAAKSGKKDGKSKAK